MYACLSKAPCLFLSFPQTINTHSHSKIHAAYIISTHHTGSHSILSLLPIAEGQIPFLNLMLS